MWWKEGGSKEMELSTPSRLRKDPILGAQCIDNMLALWENVLNYQPEKANMTTMSRVHFCNTTDADIQPWMNDTALQVTVLSTCPPELSVLQCLVLGGACFLGDVENHHQELLLQVYKSIFQTFPVFRVLVPT